MNTLILDKTDPAIQEALKDCAEGKPFKFSVEGTTNADNDTVFVGGVKSVAYEAPDEVEPEEPTDESAPVEKAYKPKAKKGSATAVEPMV